MKKPLRILSFIGGVGATVALVGAGAAGTGAYFQDSTGGEVVATTGSIKISSPDPLTLSLNGLLPGQSKSTSNATFENIGSSVQDVYMVFNPDQVADYGALVKQVGYVVVKTGNTVLFDSRVAGASFAEPIKLRDNLAEGTTGNFNVTVGINSEVEDVRAADMTIKANYKLVATQDNVLPRAED